MRVRMGERVRERSVGAPCTVRELTGGASSGCGAGRVPARRTDSA